MKELPERILSEQRFVKLTAAMEREQEENQKQLKDLPFSLCRSNEQESDVRTFIREIRQHATIQELDEGILNRLISRMADALTGRLPFWGVLLINWIFC